MSEDKYYCIYKDISQNCPMCIEEYDGSYCHGVVIKGTPLLYKLMAELDAAKERLKELNYAWDVIARALRDEDARDEVVEKKKERNAFYDQLPLGEICTYKNYILYASDHNGFHCVAKNQDGEIVYAISDTSKALGLGTLEWKIKQDIDREEMKDG